MRGCPRGLYFMVSSDLERNGGGQVSVIDDGPDQYWSPDLPPSRGQMRAITIAACRVLDIEPPTSRLAATEVLVRLRLAQADRPADVPKVDDF